MFLLNSLYLLVVYQVVLESFPVSSSGHMVIVEKFSAMFGTGFEISSLSETFDYFLHGPTIFILLIFFRKEWFNLFYFLISKPFKKMTQASQKASPSRDLFLLNSCSYRKLWSLFIQLSGYVFVADLITGAVYFSIKSLGMRTVEFAYAEQMLIVGFTITMFSLFSLFFLNRRRQITLSEITWPKVLILGGVQGLAALPGISRFGITFVVARWLGFTPRRAFQFSFLLQLPLIVAAFTKSSYKILSGTTWPAYFDFKFFIVLFVASIISYFGLTLTYALARMKRFWLFGFYMLFPISVMIGFLFI